MSGSGSNLFSVIPADELYYSDIMKKYSLFSDEEMEKMITNCMKAGLDNMDDIVLLIQEVAMDRLLDILSQQVKKGFITYEYNEQEKTIILTQTKL